MAGKLLGFAVVLALLVAGFSTAGAVSAAKSCHGPRCRTTTSTTATTGMLVDYVRVTALP